MPGSERVFFEGAIYHVSLQRQGSVLGAVAAGKIPGTADRRPTLLALAETLGEHAVTGSFWARRRVGWRREDRAFRVKYERLDKTLRRQ